MSNTKAGERKRTVTVTVGPVCERLMAEIDRAMKASPGNCGATPTTLASVALARLVWEWARVWKVEVPKDWNCAGD